MFGELMQMDELPTEILQIIMLQLDVTTLKNMSEVCQCFGTIYQNETFWEEYLIYKFPGYGGKLCNDSCRDTVLSLAADKYICLNENNYRINAMMSLADIIGCNDGNIKIWAVCNGEWFLVTNLPIYKIITENGDNLYLNIKRVGYCPPLKYQFITLLLRMVILYILILKGLVTGHHP